MTFTSVMKMSSKCKYHIVIRSNAAEFLDITFITHIDIDRIGSSARIHELFRPN